MECGLLHFAFDQKCADAGYVFLAEEGRGTRLSLFELRNDGVEMALQRAVEFADLRRLDLLFLLAASAARCRERWT